MRPLTIADAKKHCKEALEDIDTQLYPQDVKDIQITLDFLNLHPDHCEVDMPRWGDTIFTSGDNDIPFKED